MCCERVCPCAAALWMTHLLELALAGADADLPAVVDALVHTGRVLVPHIQVHIVLEGLDGQPLPVQDYLQHTGNVPVKLPALITPPLKAAGKH